MFPYSSEEVKKDKDIVLFCVKNEGLFLQHTNEENKANKEIAIAALTQSALA
jgi:hypothetical protein